MAIDRSEKQIYAIAGPTASGKTALAVELALKVNGEIINCDSVQIYRGIHIATAKPTDEERRGVPHHLIDYVDPNVDYNAVDWANDASDKIVEIEARGKSAILAGGTGFYLRTLRQPLFEGPKTDRSLRERLRMIQRRHGSPHLHTMLRRIDPVLALSLPENDHVRIIRGLEVFFQTGERLSDNHPKRQQEPEFAKRIRLFVLDPPRVELYEKINNRTEGHFAAGLVDEVKQLLLDGVNEYGNALGAHAYRRVCEYLRGERTLESAIDRSKQDVRNYAKRQLTWFRREPDVKWLHGFGSDQNMLEQILEAAPN